MIALLLMSNLLAVEPPPAAQPSIQAPISRQFVTRVYGLPGSSRCPAGRLSHALATHDLVLRAQDRADAKVKKLADEPPATACLTAGAPK